MGTKTVKMQCTHCKSQYEYRVTLTSSFMGCSISEKSRNEAAKNCPNPNCPSKKRSDRYSVFD